MKKISRLICSLFIAVILAFNTAIIPAMNVHATEYAALGLYELLQALLMSAGSSVCGLTNYNDFQLSDAAYDSLVTVVFQNNPTLAKYLAKANELDMDASFRAQLEAASEGEEFAYDDLKITKSKTGYKLQASKGLVSEAAKAIKEWAASDDNKYTDTLKIDISDMDISFVSVNICYDSIDSISSIYSSNVVSQINSLGYNDTNSFIVTSHLSDPPSKTYFTDSDIEWVNSGDVVVFIPVPFGKSYFQNDVVFNPSATWPNYFRLQSRWYSSDLLVNYYNKYFAFGSSSADDYLQNTESKHSCEYIFYFVDSGDIQVRTSKAEYGKFTSLGSVKCLFNYDDALKNNSFYFANAYLYNDSNSLPSATIYSYSVSKEHISSGSSVQYANTDDYVSMDFDSTTASTLASYSSLADYVKYATSLSAQLSDIKEAIEENNEQAKQIVSSINAQTDVISSGLSDVITSVKVQTDAISDVLEATKLQTDAIGDVIIGLDDVCSAIKDLSITLPSDLTLTIPEEKLNINVTVPDISTEVINNIEVKHDYTAESY